MSTTVVPLRLETLPSELLILILSQVDSTRSLFSLIRASPKLLQVYRHNRDQTFTCVIRNQVHAGPRIVGAVLERRKLCVPEHGEEIDEVNGDKSTWLYCHQTDREQLHRVASLISSVHVAKRCFQFQARIDRLSQDAVGEGIKVVRSYCSLPQPSVHDVRLSVSEHLRASRAFYNLAYLSLICEQNTYTHSNSGRYGLKYMGYFLNTLAFHEIEELCFALHYLTQRVHQIVVAAENDPIQRPGRKERVWSNVFTSTFDMIPESPDIPESDGGFARARQLDYQVYRIVNDSSCDIELRRDRLLSRALKTKGSKWRKVGSVDTASDLNLALHWARDEKGPFSNLSPDEAVDTLALLGLSVWDDDRLQSMDVRARNWEKFWVLRRYYLYV